MSISVIIPWWESNPTKHPVGKCQCGCGGDTDVSPYDRPGRGWVKGKPKRFVKGHQVCLVSSADDVVAWWISNGPAFPIGKCQCGCGGDTPMSEFNVVSQGRVAGKPLRFIHGHNMVGESHYAWNGGKTIDDYGYVAVTVKGRGSRDSVREHILIAEHAFGGRLPRGVVVHHVNENTQDNRPSNLVICQNNAYHKLIHRRMRAFAACGHPNWIRCVFCKKFGDPVELNPSPGRRAAHMACRELSKAVAKANHIPPRKLKPYEVMEIKKHLTDGTKNQPQLAKEFGVHQGSISNIHLGKTWKHIQLP